MKRIYLFIMTFVFIFNAHAQNDSLKISNDYLPTHEHYLGLAAGMTTGFGFSYIYWPKSFGVQITAIPIYIDKEFIYSAGLTFLKEIKQFKTSRFYFYLGNQITNFMLNVNDFRYHVGIGPGIESGKDFFRFHLRMGYALYYGQNSNSYYNTTTNNITVFPTIELGWFYNFSKEK